MWLRSAHWHEQSVVPVPSDSAAEHFYQDLLAHREKVEKSQIEQMPEAAGTTSLLNNVSVFEEAMERGQTLANCQRRLWQSREGTLYLKVNRYDAKAHKFVWDNDNDTDERGVGEGVAEKTNNSSALRWLASVASALMGQEGDNNDVSQDNNANTGVDLEDNEEELMRREK
jgi:hypothetical protein